MTKESIDTLSELIDSNSQSDYINVYISNNIEDLVKNDEFYHFPREHLLQWCKNMQNLKPMIANMLFKKLQNVLHDEVYQLLHYISIKPNDSISAAFVLSALENQLCKSVYDSSPTPDLDHRIEMLEEEVLKKNQLLEYNEENCNALKEIISQHEYNNQELMSKNRDLNEKFNMVKIELNQYKNEIVINNDHITDLKSRVRVLNQQIVEKDQRISEMENIIVSRNNTNVQHQIPESTMVSNISSNANPPSNEKSDGVFQKLRNQFGSNLKNVITVNVSSVNHGNEYNVLVNDDSYWSSNDIQNSWIQFDFKTRSFSFNSYSIRSSYGPKSWKVEGSNNLDTFTLIDQREDNKYFSFDEHIIKTFTVKSSKDRYRYVRITQGTDGRCTCTDVPYHNFCLMEIEFYGHLHE